MQFELTILGCNGAISAFDRHPSAQILNYNGHNFLLDCGEGTQFRMATFGIKRGRLDNIFITHLHGDHYYGLIGLLTTLNLNAREHPLHIYAPEGMEEIITIQLKHSQTILRFPVHYHVIPADKPMQLFESPMLTVETIILKHRIATTGFLFREKKHLRKILPEKIEEYHIPHDLIVGIKQGNDFKTSSGKVISNNELTIAAPEPRSYAYCTDTAFTDSFKEQIKGVSVLYHESTFAEEHKDRALETFHSTTKQAATVAKMAGVGKLIIGHFSARYENLQALLDESREVFPETYLAEEGKVFHI